MLHLKDLEEYDYAADWCAVKGITGAIGDPLPDLLSTGVCLAINDDPEAFARRVSECAYARAHRIRDRRTRGTNEGETP